ncbi:Carotenoid 9,10(9',10')-cleavage dioxygenase 1 [Acorus calamus]|uniref:Carotenoid 9,10(9',10')-cleavage dioxygenase 1 n=1 Tax=Acorus calamus TaxID=4465 RepID=A0AAV9EN08_ACOCL|nr:Carotenoid 9,10(9',10')-cleavage dioxygenase 1 [Acorus calamus]
MKTGEVKEGHLAQDDIAMDFPAINNRFMGLKNKYAYAQVLDSEQSSNIGMSMYKQLAKIYFDEHDEENKKIVKVECRVLEDNHFCSGVQFVERPGATDEDDGWVVCYIHDEKSNVSKVYIVDAKKFTEPPVAKIILPQRVPDGFHGTYTLTDKSLLIATTDYLYVFDTAEHRNDLVYQRPLLYSLLSANMDAIEEENQKSSLKEFESPRFTLMHKIVGNGFKSNSEIFRRTCN